MQRLASRLGDMRTQLGQQPRHGDLRRQSRQRPREHVAYVEIRFDGAAFHQRFERACVGVRAERERRVEPMARHRWPHSAAMAVLFRAIAGEASNLSIH